jgi:hypothetical protein
MGVKYLRLIPNSVINTLIFIFCLFVLSKTYVLDLSQLSPGAQILNCDLVSSHKSFDSHEVILSKRSFECLYHQE